MGYAGITGNNDVQSRTDPYFNHISVRQIVDYIKKQSCPTTENVSNTPLSDSGFVQLYHS